MAKKALFKLLRRDPRGLAKMASLASPRPTGARESESMFQNPYNKFPMM